MLKNTRSFLLRTAPRNDEKWEDKLHDQEEDSSIPIKPQRVMHALRK